MTTVYNPFTTWWRVCTCRGNNST